METNPEYTHENEKKTTYTLFDMARRVILAGIGAMAVSYEEMEIFIDKLVERGEIAKRDGESLLNEIRDRRKKHAHGEETYFQRTMDEYFKRLNIPTKNDLDSLSSKITALEIKIDELTNRKKGTP